MKRKKTSTSKAAKTVRTLPAKTLNAKSAKGVKGGFRIAPYFNVVVDKSGP